MQFDQPATDRETKPGTGVLTGIRVFDLLKLLENTFLICGCNPNTGITHPQDHLITIGTGTNRNFTQMRKLTGIRDQIEQDLPHPHFISKHGR
jgi:hypothetical protein